MPAEDVRLIAADLKQITLEELRACFSAKAFNAAGIYPQPRPGGWTEEEAEPAFDLFPGLAAFFQDAANADEVILIYVS